MQDKRLLPIGLAAVLAMQGVGMVFFLMDAGEELAHDPAGLHPISEAVVALALAFGAFVVGQALFRSLRLVRLQQSALAVASAEFHVVMEDQFDRWKLSKAEKEIALLSLQGKDIEEIAALRGSAAGTVRAQLAKIYGKSGVSNRSQLSAVFVERLISAKSPQAPDAKR